MWNKAVVTGAAGFIGGHLCNRLKSDGVKKIIGVDSLRSGDWSRTPEMVQRIEKDIADVSNDEWDEYLRDTDVVFHLAAEKYNSSKSTPDKLLEANVFATEHLFRAIAKNKVSRTVFTSSLYAYGSMGPKTMQESDIAEPRTLYGASKLMGEGILRSLDRELGMSWNVARLFFIYGPHQHAEGGYKSVIMTNFERLLRGEQPVIFGDGLQSLDYVYIDDCIDALITLAKSPIDKQVVNVATGASNSVSDLTELMIKVSRATIAPKYGAADWTDGSRRCGDPTKINEIFGWQAKTSMSTGLENVYEWLRNVANV